MMSKQRWKITAPKLVVNTKKMSELTKLIPGKTLQCSYQ